MGDGGLDDCAGALEPMKVAGPGQDGAEGGGDNSAVEGRGSLPQEDLLEGADGVAAVCEDGAALDGLQAGAEGVERVEQGDGGQAAARAGQGVRVGRVDRPCGGGDGGRGRKCGGGGVGRGGGGRGGVDERGCRRHLGGKDVG